MAKRYRIYQVRDNVLVRKILFDVPNCTANPNYPYIYPGETNIQSYSALASYVVNNSSGTISDFSNFLLYLTNAGMPLDTILPNYSFTNKIDVNDINVDDKFYVNKWDNNHPYIIVTTKETQSGGTILLRLNYCLANNVVVYNNVTWQVSTSRAQDNTLTFPWCWYITETSNLQLFSANIGVYTYDSNKLIRVNPCPTFSPSSLENARIFWGFANIIDPDNPYLDGGTSEPGGGNPDKQNFSDESDLVSADNMPDEGTYGATSCGLVTIFKPSKSQLKHLAEVMWGTNVISFLQNMVENISSMFISLGMVPFNVDAGATVSVQWLGLVDTAISLTLAANQWYEFNMGSIALDGTDDRIWATDTVLDYSPFSKLGIYLPFIGYQELDIDECRNHVLTLTYRIDILSGTCIAQIDISGRTIYQFTGNCLTQLPLTSMDAQSLFTNAVNIGIAAASAGSTGAVASAGDAFTQENVASGRLSDIGGEAQHQQRAAQVANAEGSLASATANGMMGMKPSFKKTGAISASSSLFGVMQPYLFLTTPRQSVPEKYQHFCGLPCNMTGKLGDFSGLTVVEDVRLNGLVATSPEVEEIYNLLKSGVII